MFLFSVLKFRAGFSWIESLWPGDHPAAFEAVFRDAPLPFVGRRLSRLTAIAALRDAHDHGRRAYGPLAAAPWSEHEAMDLNREIFPAGRVSQLDLLAVHHIAETSDLTAKQHRTTFDNIPSPQQLA